MSDMDRRIFLKSNAFLLIAALSPAGAITKNKQEVAPYFSLKPIGRSLQLDDYFIWCSSPIWGDDGKVHLFYSRWRKDKGMGGWIKGSEIAHAVAESPYESFQHKEVVLQPRDGCWDSTTCHNPLIKKVGDMYYLFYMGNCNGKTDTKRIGVATAKTLDGPWKRSDSPILLPEEEGAWDDHCTTNPAFLQGDDGKFWLYYKSWNTAEYLRDTGPVRGNRKYGLAKADHPLGPYHKVSERPVIDFSGRPNNAQLEDAFVWQQDGQYCLIARDMGFYNHEYGLILMSKNGIQWSEPQVAYLNLAEYVHEATPPANLKRFGRLERPMILMDRLTNEPRFLFGATQGGKADTSTTFIFEII